MVCEGRQDKWTKASEEQSPAEEEERARLLQELQQFHQQQMDAMEQQQKAAGATERTAAGVARLTALPKLRDLLLHGNPITDQFKDNNEAWRLEVLKRLPNLKVRRPPPRTRRAFRGPHNQSTPVLV